MRDAMLGWLASSTLNPQKKTNSSAASAPIPGWPATRISPAWTSGDHRHRSQEHGPQVAAPLQRKQRQAHDHERGQHGGKVHVPVLLLGQAGLHQQRRNRHPHRQLHRVQHENAHVQAQQPGMTRALRRVFRGARSCAAPARAGSTTPPRQCSPGPAAPVTANSPPRPICATSKGATTSDRANIRPMLAPTRAIALVRTSSRVWSASKAVTAADTAPAPCKERPAISQPRVCAPAAMKLPAANTSRPKMITRLRPSRSEAMPIGDLQDALGQAIDAHGQADQGRIGAARVSGRLQREHRKDQEQAEHARGKDGRQGAAGTALHRRHAGGDWGERRL